MLSPFPDPSLRNSITVAAETVPGATTTAAEVAARAATAVA